MGEPILYTVRVGDNIYVVRREQGVLLVVRESIRDMEYYRLVYGVDGGLELDHSSVVLVPDPYVVDHGIVVPSPSEVLVDGKPLWEAVEDMDPTRVFRLLEKIYGGGERRG